jgi:hypothetical protein
LEFTKYRNLSKLEADRLDKNFQIIVQSFKQQLLTEINSLLAQSFKSYYQGNPHPSFLPLDLYVPEKSIVVDLLYNSDPTFDNSRNAVIYHHNGFLIDNNKEKSQKKSLKFLETVSENWDNFSPNDGKFQIFLDFNLFQNILSNETTNKTINFVIDEKNFFGELPFNLTIDSLSKFLPEISKNFSLTEVIYLSVNLTNAAFNVKGYQITGTFDIIIEVLHKETLASLLSWSNKVNHTYIFDISNHKVNLNFDKFIVHSFELIKSNYGSPTEAALLAVVLDSLKSGNEHKKFRIFKDGIDFSSHFRASDLTLIRNQGVLIYGKNK